MAWKTVTKKRPISISPPEAVEIAASFRTAAEKIRQLSAELRSMLPGWTTLPGKLKR
jgi:hypothetical protein